MKLVYDELNLFERMYREKKLEPMPTDVSK
jgi:hypothetical protein